VSSLRRTFWFYGLVFVLSLPFYVLGAVLGKDGLPVALPWSALMVVCPTGAAISLTLRDEGTAGVRRLLGRAVDVGRIRPAARIVPVLLVMPAVMLLSYGVQRLLGQDLPALAMSWLDLPALFALFLLGALLEEVGWMGYVADPWLDRWGTLRTGLGMGALWALWHLLPWWQTVPDAGWVAWQAFATIWLRVLLTWSYAATHRSVSAVILLHASSNVCTFSFPVGGSHYDPAVTGVILAAAGLLLWWQGPGASTGR
jgi:membrane protease YdiL (CAAX protease family)